MWEVGVVFRAWFSLLAMIVALGPAAASAEGSRVSLKEVIEAARRQPPRVLAALASLERARAEHHAARGAYLPTLTLQGNASLGYDERPLFTGDATSARIEQVTSTLGGSLSTDLRLLDPARRKAVHAADKRRLAAVEAVVDVQRQAVEAAVELYLRALGAERLVDAAVEAKERRGMQHEAVSGLVDAGLRPPVDATRTQVEAVSARYALDQRRLERQRAYSALARAVGRDPARGVMPRPIDALSARVPRSAHEATALALAHRPDLKRLRAQVEAQQEEVRSRLLRRLPVLGVSGAGSVSNLQVLRKSQNSFTTPGVTYAASGMLYLRWTGLDASQIRSADSERAALHETQRALERALLDVRAEAADAVYALRIAERQAESARRVRAAADETRQAQTHRYQAGAASLLDLLDAEGLAQNARVDEIEAALRLNVARLRLLSACATLERLL